MAKRIQAGERAAGREDFWGYVWQGAMGEALTCNAMEWQASEGGGRIIESDHTISVNNPATIRGWQRAKRWVGSISPPAVFAYRELDSMNVFSSGGAAFNRVWLGTMIARSGQSRRVYWRNLNPVVETGYTSMPAGPGGSAGILGGSGLAVSRHSAHRKEAIDFLRFLVSAQIQSNEKRESRANSESGIYNLPSALDVRSDSQKPTPRLIGFVSRPSVEAGAQYQQVSTAYAAAVHSVLTGQKTASVAAAELEKQLVQITGFRTAPHETAK
jgi:trehalose/maltose transport system substrate-binding protein